MILPPQDADDLGVAVLDTNADTRFSFTNALGLVCADQVRRLQSALNRFPHGRWILALHHHVLEYPMPVSDLSERIGTALINGSWFVRAVKPYGRRVVVMHGHRHVDWIGRCGELRIISAPSPVMGEKHTGAAYFYVHTFVAGADGGLDVLRPERVEVGEVGHTGNPGPVPADLP